MDTAAPAQQETPARTDTPTLYDGHGRPETVPARIARIQRQREATERRAARKQQAFDLVIAGYSYRAAAQRMGCSFGEVGRLYREALEEMRLRQADTSFTDRQLVRCDRMIQAQWPKALAGDTAASREAARWVDIQNRLAGAYPNQLEIDMRPPEQAPPPSEAETWRELEVLRQTLANKELADADAAGGPIYDAEIVESADAVTRDDLPSATDGRPEMNGTNGSTP